MFSTQRKLLVYYLPLQLFFSGLKLSVYKNLYSVNLQLSSNFITYKYTRPKKNGIPVKTSNQLGRNFMKYVYNLQCHFDMVYDRYI